MKILVAGATGVIGRPLVKRFDDATGQAGETQQTMIEHEREVLEATGFDGLCLRYGMLYGPGT